MVQLRDVVEDQITGYTGMVVAITEYVNGCRSCAVQKPELDEKGVPHKWQWFDQQQLTIKETTIPIEEESSGGPHEAPPELQHG